MADIVYTLSVTIRVPVEPEDQPEAYTTSKELRRLERQVINALGRLDGDVDCEVVETSIAS